MRLAIPSPSAEQGPPPPNSAAALTPEDHQRIFRSLAAVDPNFEIFAINFPSTKARILRAPDKRSQISVQADLRFGDEYTVAYWVTADFSADLGKASRPRCDIFGAHDLKAIARLRGNEVGVPLRFSPDEIPEFCQNPVRFLRAKFGAKAKR